MNISLTPELEKLVKNKVSSGLYNSSSEVVREALRLMEQRDQGREVALQEIREAVDAGLNSGEGRPFNDETVADICKRGREKLAARQLKG